LRTCGDGIDTALADLRALARGIHPAILTDEGLVAALRALVERAPIAVDLTTSAVPRLPAPVEATAYHVVAEALTNAMKHAGTGRVRVAVAHGDGHVRVEVADDGRGGADPAGSGLRGLTDRVRALDGDLVVRGGPGHGTSVTAVLPWGAP
jgi:signal transduction histidine kinase